VDGKAGTLKDFTQHHDLGFYDVLQLWQCIPAHGQAAYKDILVQSARSLSTRFTGNRLYQIVEYLNSWHGNKAYNFPVIIDNMMNLELLFFASRATGDTSFRHIAVTQRAEYNEKPGTS